MAAKNDTVVAVGAVGAVDDQMESQLFPSCSSSPDKCLHCLELAGDEDALDGDDRGLATTVDEMEDDDGLTIGMKAMLEQGALCVGGKQMDTHCSGMDGNGDMTMWLLENSR